MSSTLNACLLLASHFTLKLPKVALAGREACSNQYSHPTLTPIISFAIVSYINWYWMIKCCFLLLKESNDANMSASLKSSQIRIPVSSSSSLNHLPKDAIHFPDVESVRRNSQQFRAQFFVFFAHLALYVSSKCGCTGLRHSGTNASNDCWKKKDI